MNFQEAKRILGLNGNESEKEIKKKYRDLIRKSHPDNSVTNLATDLEHNAASINEAYEFVVKYGVFNDKLNRWDDDKNSPYFTGTDKSKKRSSKSTSAKANPVSWKAPVNPNAYTERPIYHNVEDSNGEKIGTIEVARGKYIWTLEEDFPLFLKSIYETGKKVLARIENDKAYDDISAGNSYAYDESSERNCKEYAHNESSESNSNKYSHNGSIESLRQVYLAKLVYLLAGQYVDGLVSLEALTSKDTVKSDSRDSELVAYYIQAMLEPELGLSPIKPGTLLYPAGIVNHRLFLRRLDGQIVGYVSFKDDRLYYAIVPLFEQRRVQVKVEVSDWHYKSRAHGPYADITLWLKLNEISESMVDSTTLKIDSLLKEYAEEITH